MINFQMGRGTIMDYKPYLLNGISILFGFIGGTAINAITQLILERKKNNKQLKNLRFEVDLNIKKIDVWFKELNKYRNAVNSETMYLYFSYFDFSRFITVTADNMFREGTLYNYLNHEDISNLQIIFSEFSLGWENIINDEVKHYRDEFDKVKATASVNFWEEKLGHHKETLQGILATLKQ
jgi:hypothetical protein